MEINATNLKKFITEPSSKPSGCDLPRKARVNLNRSRSGVGHTQQFLHKTGAESSPNRVCGEIQTVERIIHACPTYKSPHDVPGLLELDEDTISWLKSDLPV